MAPAAMTRERRCDFCKAEARAWYQHVAFCSWDLLVFYLGVDYVSRVA